MIVKVEQTKKHLRTFPDYAKLLEEAEVKQRAARKKRSIAIQRFSLVQEVAGVVSFYHDFRDAPAGKHVIKLCRAEACQSMGGTEMIARLEHALGMKVGETKGDVTLEAVYCLGLCACAPAAMVGNQLVGRASAERIEALVAEVSA